MKFFIRITALILLACSLNSCGYNGLVDADEGVEQEWANVEVAYQRRNDLIGNLVKTVQGAADYEKGALVDVINARAKATSINIDPSNITPEQLAQFNKVQGGLSGALKSLLVTVERYPDLKANQNFLKLQDELASTENQILTTRTRFNEKAGILNVMVRKFPTIIAAKIFGFDAKPYFKSEAGAEKPVEVDFNFK